jgi:hypothetical protein
MVKLIAQMLLLQKAIQAIIALRLALLAQWLALLAQLLQAEPLQQQVQERLRFIPTTHAHCKLQAATATPV